MPTALLRQHFSALRTTLRLLGDEFEQALVRLVFITVFVSYLAADALVGDRFSEHVVALSIATAYFTVAIAILAAIYRSPRQSHLRHTITMVCDVVVTTACLYLSGPAGAFLYVVYLWLSIGNGFRYGLRYLFLCMTLSLVGFGGILVFSDFWAKQSTVGAGLLFGLAALPLFASTLANRLHVALRRAEEASQAKSRFVANMSHELRTPLNGVVGMTHLMMGTPLSPVAKEYGRAVLSSSDQLMSLINNILDFAKIEAGRIEVENVEFDVYGLLHGLKTLFLSQAQERGLRLMLHVDPTVSPRLNGDPVHIRQVLANLIGNAIKFTERGSVDVRLGPADPADPEKGVCFEIEDTGIGIAPEALPRVFEMFTQADASTTRRFGGTGLGTTIARQLAELMGGSVRVVSELGVGTVFSVTLPCAPVRVETDKRKFSGARVLLTGSTAAQALLTEHFRALGIAPSVCASPHDALVLLNRASATGSPFDVAFLASGASESDPDIVLRAMNSGPLPSHLTTVLVCAAHESRETAERLRAGYSFVVTASVTMTILCNVLRFARAHLPTAQHHAWISLAARSLRILVAEDNPTNQLVIRGILESAGHKSRVVADGEAAVAALEGEEFDLAIVDMHMPRMNGAEVVKMARWMMPPERNFPIVVLTADATRAAISECAAAGASAFVTKPVDPRRLLAEIETLVGLAEAGRPARITRGDDGDPGDAESGPPLLDEHRLNELRSLSPNGATLSGFVEAFEGDGVAELVRIREASASSRLADVRDSIHALKGSAGSIGARKLFALCAAIETWDDRILVERLPRAMPEIAEIHASACSALQAYLAQQRSARVG
jgi:two-component system, sensor histidine kinase RpfC